MALTATYHDPVTEIGSDGFQSFTKLPAATANLLLENDMYLKARPVSRVSDVDGTVFSTSSTSFVDVTGASVSITASGSSRLLILASGWATSAAGSGLVITATIDGTNQGDGAYGLCYHQHANTGPWAISFLTAAVVSDGAHTVKLQAKVTGSTLAINGLSLVVMEVG